MGNKNLLITVGAVTILVIIGILTVGKASRQQVQIQNAANEKSTREFSARFLSYSDENLKKATQNNGKAVIFFHASWCPTCQLAESDLRSNFEKVPKNITILKTDYDTSTKLKSKYGVAWQDTWVQVDAQGNELVKWNSGGEGVNALLANVK